MMMKVKEYCATSIQEHKSSARVLLTSCFNIGTFTSRVRYGVTSKHLFGNTCLLSFFRSFRYGNEHASSILVVLNKIYIHILLNNSMTILEYDYDTMCRYALCQQLIQTKRTYVYILRLQFLKLHPILNNELTITIY